MSGWARHVVLSLYDNLNKTTRSWALRLYSVLTLCGAGEHICR
jgi:hypothetical protein